jgi:hypothetical protein
MRAFTVKLIGSCSVILYNSVSAAKIVRGEIAEGNFNVSRSGSGDSV